MKLFNTKPFIKKFFIFSLLIIFFLLVFNLSSLTFTPPAYHAVFLTNGQIYFGHIKKLTSDIIQLENVYYLRTQTNLSNETFNLNNDTSDIQLSIVKLGKEIHAPTDRMMINRQQVLFWEELREEGEVVKAIKKNR